MLFATIICITFSAPGQTIGVSVFTDHLIGALGISRLRLSSAYALGTVCSSFLLTRVGKSIDRFGNREVTLAASVLFGSVLFLMSIIDKITRGISSFTGFEGAIVPFLTVSAGFFLMRFLGQGVITLSGRTMLAKWFDEKRGRMNAVSGVFVSMMFAGSPVVFETLIKSSGWRGAWRSIGTGLLFFFPLFILFFFRNNPESCGLNPDGDIPENTKYENATRRKQISWTLGETRKNPVFRIFNLSVSMSALIITAVTFHIVSIFTENGMSRADAVSIFLPSSVIAVAVNLFAGWLIDKKIRDKLKFIIIASNGGLILLCAGVVLIGNGAGKVLIIIGNGTASGLMAALTTVVWPSYFGIKHIGAISGLNTSFMVFFSAAGPLLLGLSFKYSGSYTLSAALMALLTAGLLIASFFAEKPEYPGKFRV
ncbi:MAG: MFS transporter [Fibrobacterota bacterium]